MIVTGFLGIRRRCVGDRARHHREAPGGGERVADRAGLCRTCAADGVGEQAHRVVAEGGEGVLGSAPITSSIRGHEASYPRCPAVERDVRGVVDVVGERPGYPTDERRVEAVARQDRLPHSGSAELADETAGLRRQGGEEEDVRRRPQAADTRDRGRKVALARHVEHPARHRALASDEPLPEESCQRSREV
jgi:hypothetical protein